MKKLLDYQGRIVRLTEERLVHILQHREMRGMESALAETLRYPTFVIASRTDPVAELAYRFYTRTAVGDKWLCVVVKYAPRNAFLLTAYLTDKPKKGEQIWPIK